MSEKKFTQALISFALDTGYGDIPADIIEIQKKSLLDSIGVMSAATTLEPACLPFIDFAAENSSASECTIFGTGRKASVLMAAMANGSLIHALDFEDGHDASKTHPNTASIPVMLAIGESFRSKGKDVLAAMAVSAELAIRLKLSVTVDDLMDCGWYSPPMFSAYGAVLGASRLMGMDFGLALDALSICMTQIISPGQSAYSGQSVLRGIREAFSARAAVFSALLAAKGVKARMDEPFEGKFGLFMSCFHGKYDPAKVTCGLGEQWEVSRLRYKPWPCCGTSHAVLDTIFTLMESNSIIPEEIEDIHLIINGPHLNLLEPRGVKYRPKSLAAAKFSLPFSIALAVNNGNVTLDMYSDNALDNPVLLSIADKVSYELRPVDPAKPKTFYSDDHVEVVIKTAHGSFGLETFSSSGSSEKPLSDRQISDKFFNCMRHSEKPYDINQCRRIFETIQSFDLLPDINTFCRLFN
jgi:2-methylcitrate dehydratase PrpD